MTAAVPAPPEQLDFLAAPKRQGKSGEWHNTRNARHEYKMRQAFRALWPAMESTRAQEINALPAVIFKGRDLIQLNCIDCLSPRNVPRGTAWSLIALDHYICPSCMFRGGKVVVN